MPPGSTSHRRPSTSPRTRPESEALIPISSWPTLSSWSRVADSTTPSWTAAYSTCSMTVTERALSEASGRSLCLMVVTSCSALATNSPATGDRGESVRPRFSRASPMGGASCRSRSPSIPKGHTPGWQSLPGPSSTQVRPRFGCPQDPHECPVCRVPAARCSATGSSTGHEASMLAIVACAAPAHRGRSIQVTGRTTLGRSPILRKVITMAKLIFSAITSLDGYMEDEDGNFDWGAPDEEVHSFVNDLERPVGTYLYGRRMYETMVYWETVQARADEPPCVRDFTELWQAVDKIVYSKSLETVSSAKTRIA